MMKIALIATCSAVHTTRWANALAGRGNEVYVISCKNHCKTKDLNYVDGVTIIPLKFSAPLGYYLNAHQLKKIVKREKFDVINIHYASGYGTLGRKAGLRKALLNVWGSDVYDFPYQSKFNMRTIRKNLLYYSALASTSNVMAKQTQKLIPEYKGEIYITPFGVDTKLFRPIDGIKPQDSIILGTVKTLSPTYGIADTIQAFIKLIGRLQSEGRQDISDKLYYEIYGKGELKDDLQKLIDNNGMHEKIKLCGYVSNDLLPEIYNRFYISNSNSNSESFGVAAVEAMACGIPVQVSDADGFCEVVNDGVTGLIAPKGDINAIADNMYKLLMDRNLRDKMSIAAVEHVKSLYDWGDNVDEMIKLYKITSGQT